ncbi:MAG: serine/threonine-protein phosphatase [Acidobacteria bacterium]|nr:serine/threonine-protein phosphatase [Acidobacteriota bacterium]
MVAVMSPPFSDSSSAFGPSSDRLSELRSLQLSFDVRATACGLSTQGTTHIANEDNFLVFHTDQHRRAEAGDTLAAPVGAKGILLAVADGLGGNLAGEIASGLTVQALSEEWIVRYKQRPPEEAFLEAVEATNERVWSAWQNNPAWHGMGATLTAVLLLGRTAHVVEVGDSRCYLLRNRTLRQVTEDQSVSEMLVKNGEMSRTDASYSTGNSVVLQAVGLRSTVTVAQTSVDVKQGDWLILCSDGMYNTVSNDEILATVLAAKSPAAATARLSEMARERGSHDDATVVIAQVSGTSLNLPDNNEEISSSFHMLQDYNPIRSGEFTRQELREMLNIRRERYARAHTKLLIGLSSILLLTVLYLLFKIVGF